MKYTSTRNNSVFVDSAKAISQGISEDGGLFVPVSFPQISLDDIKRMSEKDYIGRAKEVLKLFLTDFTEEEIDSCVKGAYKLGKFDSEKVAPIVPFTDVSYILELFRGPTCAFKDMALQLLPHLLTVSAKKTAEGKEIVILVATSGDTGKAALEGFKDVENTKILVFYPSDGVSPMQKLQMTTQEGENVSVCAIEGNFDDAQSGVKRIFIDKEIRKKLEKNNMQFSSANSINWGRLVPQVVYYISAYCDLIAEGRIVAGERINIVVPTGNFGNILAAYYAKQMGLPVNKFICASNANNVLTDFIKTGEYNKNREFFTTTSPSMDILISSNLERLLYHLTGCDDKAVSEMMNKLSSEGRYTVSEEVFKKLSEDFDAGFCGDDEVSRTIAKSFKEKNYLPDTHTSVAIKVYEDYVERTGDDTVTVIASTANPYKFSTAVLGAIEPECKCGDEFETVSELARASGVKCPQQLANLKGRKPRFTEICTKPEMTEVVFKMLGI